MIGFLSRLTRAAAFAGALVLLSMLLGSAALAQRDSSIAPGARVKLALAHPQKRSLVYTGTVVAVTDSSVVLRPDRARWETEIPRDSIARVQLSRGKQRGHTALRGVLIGAAAGAALGAVAGEDCSHSTEFICFDRSETIPAGALAFGGLGGLVGFLIGGERWSAPLAPASVAVTPGVWGGVALSTSIAFR